MSFHQHQSQQQPFKSVDPTTDVVNVIPQLSTDQSKDVAQMLSEVLDSQDNLRPNTNSTTSQGARLGRDSYSDLSSYYYTSADESYFPEGAFIYSDVTNDTGRNGNGGNDDNSQTNINDDTNDQLDRLPETELEQFVAQRKHYFIFSSAGKVIYSMHGSDQLVLPYMGILQTIVSYFDPRNAVNEYSGMNENSEENRSARGDSPSTQRPSMDSPASSSAATASTRLKSFRAGRTLFVATVDGPLILVAIDKMGYQNEQHLHSQLSVLYAQILSVLTKSQIAKAFAARSNFDLRQLLGGVDVFLDALTRDMSRGSPPILLGAVECLKLRKSVRDKMNSILVECRSPSLLYGMIVADSRLVSVIRPRRHSLHPPDLHLIFSMLFNANSFRNGGDAGGEHWVPICLPKFNSTGFLYAYIHFFTTDAALVLISPDKSAFFELRAAKDRILSKLTEHPDNSLVAAITDSVVKGRFKPLDIGAPLIRHFLYKAKNYVQFVMPSLDLHYYDPRRRQQLMNLYHELHSAVHSQQGNIKILYLTKHNLTALAWITPKFEMYCVAGVTTKDALFESVKATVAWIKRHEERLFVIGGAVF